MKSSWIFKSRWMALAFAAGIVWFAYGFAASQPQGGDTSADKQASTANNAL